MVTVVVELEVVEVVAEVVAVVEVVVVVARVVNVSPASGTPFADGPDVASVQRIIEYAFGVLEMFG